MVRVRIRVGVRVMVRVRVRASRPAGGAAPMATVTCSRPGVNIMGRARVRSRVAVLVMATGKRGSRHLHFLSVAAGLRAEAPFIEQTRSRLREL